MDTSYKVLTEMAATEATNQGTGNDPSGLGSGVVPLDGGSLACLSRTDQGNTEHFSSLEDMKSAASNFCQNRANEKLDWETPAEGEPSNPYNAINLRDDNGIRIGASYNSLGDTSCPSLDFGSPGALQMCIERFGAITNNCKRADSHMCLDRHHMLAHANES